MQPKYKAIRDFILQKIRDSGYLPDSKIPPEMELAKSFHVSRMTANKAVMELVKEGVLIRKQGMGTFVVGRKAESPLLEIKNIADEVRERGSVYSNELILLEKIKSDENVAAGLGVKTGDPVFHSLIVHKENGIPIQLSDRYVNAKLVPDYGDQDFTLPGSTPGKYLTEQFPLSELEHIVEAVIPTKQEQELLDISEFDPCLLVNRRTWSDGFLVSSARLIHPGSRYRLLSRTKKL